MIDYPGLGRIRGDVPVVAVRDTHETMMVLAGQLRLGFDGRIAAITGSNGKTTTKEMIAAVLGRPITIYGDGMQVRDVLFISDLIDAYQMALNHIETTGGRVYNIGGGAANTLSLLQLLDFLRAELNPDLPAAFADWRPGDQPVYVSDIGRAEREFGWHPKTSWQEGTRQLLDWVKDNRGVIEKLF